MVGPGQDVAQEPEGVERPWEKRGAVRRDCEPHRGELLARLGRACACLGLGSLFLVPLVLLSLPLGLVVCWCAGADVRKMYAGTMDPHGLGPTAEAWSNSAFGLALSVGVLVFWGGFALLAGLLRRGG